MRVAAAVAVLLLGAGCLSSSDDAAPPSTSAPSVHASDCLSIVHGVDLQNATLAQLQAALANGTITSVDLVDAYEARIAAFDSAGPKLNSIRALNPNARAEAAALDAERAAGHVRGPFHGIPVLLKDNIGTTEMPTTAGSIALALNVPPVNATLEQKLVDAGAIILGKTNLSEFANWVDLSMPNGYSSLGGQVINAYTGGDPSGSSSGSGVAASMAFAAIAVGTETSGSILGPSDANSLVGVKPTVGLVSRAGVIPLAGNFDTPGPMGRHVQDAASMLGIMAGSDPLDPATAAADSHLPPDHDYVAGLSPDALKGVRLGYDAGDGGALFEQAKADLQALGAVLVPIDTRIDPDSPGIVELGLIFNEFKFGINDYIAHQAGPGLPVTDLTGIILYNNDHQDKVKYGQNLLITSDATQGEKNSGDVAALAVITANRAVADKAFSDANVEALIGPHLRYVSVGAAAGYPTVIVPIGYNGNDPEGISFFGPAWSEAKLLDFAYAFEQGTHHRTAPPVITPSLLSGICVQAHAADPPAAEFAEPRNR